MNESASPTTTADPSGVAQSGGPAAEARLPGRWPVGVLGGALAGLPIGWLLSYGGLLPFYLGLFFFLLFGLLLGAVVYRLGAPARPLGRAWLAGGTAVVVLVTWGVSMLIEAHTFPSQVAKVALEKTRKLPAGATPDSFLRDSQDDVARHLRDKYAPGGVIGYMRWQLTDSQIKPPVGRLPKTFRSTQPRLWWGIRVLLSITLLSVGIYSQIAALRREASQQQRRDGTTVNPLSKI